MPAPKKGARFGSGPSHQKHMLANLASSLIISDVGAITTTEAKAKALRPYVEKLITKAKHGGVHKQRQVVATIHDKDADAQAVRRHRAALRRPQRRLHAHPEARSALGRQRPHGAHRTRLKPDDPCRGTFSLHDRRTKRQTLLL